MHPLRRFCKDNARIRVIINVKMGLILRICSLCVSVAAYFRGYARRAMRGGRRRGKVLSLSDLKMTRSMSLVWKILRVDARITLKISFRNAMSNPKMIDRYYGYNRCIDGIVWEIHEFCIGDAEFGIALYGSLIPILFKACLNDGDMNYSGLSSSTSDIGYSISL